MSAVSLPVNRPLGRALIVAAPGARGDTLRILGQLGYEFQEADDPYSGFVELCRNRLNYTAVILGLSSLYREELSVVAAIKRRLPHLEIWLTHTDGRHAALADAVRQGADGLLAEDGLHRIADSSPDEDDSPSQSTSQPVLVDSSTTQGCATESMDDFSGDDGSLGEPVLSSEELRALLQEQPSNPPSGSSM